MIPGQGFLGAAGNTNASFLDKLLPVDFLATYSDTIRRGKPTGTVSRVVGSFVVELTIPNRLFVITLRQRGVHGAVLVDRVF